MTTIDRWKNWKPKAQALPGPTGSSPSAVPPSPQKFGDSSEDEPTKTAKTVFDVFVGSTLANSQKIEAAPIETERAGANAVLGQAGVRLMTLPEGVCVGIWSDLDGPEVRAALAVFHPDVVPPIRYLDGSGIPMKFKERRVPGEPVPLDVLAAMEQCPAEPWAIRDRILTEIGWWVNGIPWAQWQATARKRLLEKQREARWLCV